MLQAPFLSLFGFVTKVLGNNRICVGQYKGIRVQVCAFPVCARKFKRNPKEYFSVQTSVYVYVQLEIFRVCFPIVVSGGQNEGELQHNMLARKMESSRQLAFEVVVTY